MARRLALNLFAIFVGIFFSLVFLEGALRIYNPIIQTVKGVKVVLPVYYNEVRKNTRVTGLQTTPIPGVATESHIHQNSLGFRGADPPADFADRLTMITVGGSTTRSAAQSDDRTWTALLGTAVAGCFDRTWINNAGFEGHSSFGHIDLIRNYINKLHPKVVVLLIGANEFHLRSWWAGFTWVLNALAARSEVVDLGLTLHRSYRAWKDGLNSSNLIEGDAMPDDGEARLAAARDLQPEYAERLRLIIQLLRDAQTIPVLMTQPSLAGTGRDPTTGMEFSRLWYGEFFRRSFEIYNATMRQVAQSENVHLIDLAPVMPKDTKYYFDNMHYTDEGAKKVAELAAIELLPYLARKFPSFNKGTCQIRSAKPG